MKRKLAIQEFIENHHDWEKLLLGAPYCIDISRKEMFGHRLMLLKYRLIDEPDFTNDIVKECRGLILDEDTLEIVSYPFNKFMNFSEPEADRIDWNTAKVGTKIDGSIIKIVRLEGNLLISTNGCIDASDATISNDIPNKRFSTYREIVEHCLSQKYSRFNLDDSIFKEGYTYIFEMVSPETRVVIPYDRPNLYFIGLRDNNTLKEQYFKTHEMAQWFDTPEEHSLASIDDCISMCEKMPWDEEGYVVVDSDFHRVKVKSLAWLSIHRLSGNGVMTYSRAIELYLTNECSEVLAYFPEYDKIIEEVKTRFNKLVNDLNEEWDEFVNNVTTDAPRKEQAAWILKNFDIPAIAFGMLDGKIRSPEEWLRTQPSWKIANSLKLS